MNVRPAFAGLLISAVLILYSHSVCRAPKSQTRFASHGILLKFKKGHPSPGEGIIRQILPWRIHIESLSPDDPAGPYLVSLPRELSAEHAMAIAANDYRVDYAEPNYPIYGANTVPNDPYFQFMWQLNNNAANEYLGKRGADIGAVRAWDITTGSKDVVVAILDTGFELRHPDLAANVWNNPGEIPDNGLDDDRNGFVDDVSGWNFLHDNNQLFEDPAVDYHGTHIAGIIGAVGNNKIGTTGVAWRVSLMTLKVLDGHGNKGLSANSVRAINYVVSQKRAGANVKVINASWVNEGESLAVRDAIEAAGRAGIVFVCAAGNDAKNLDQDPIYPAARSAELATVISVAATDRFDNLQPFSNYGRKTISVAAPGTGILGLELGGQYAEHSGTSMATAHVSGIAVLMAARHPTLTPAQIKHRIISTAEPIAGLSSCCVGVGRANAFNALTNTIRVIKIPVVGVVHTLDDTLIVDGFGFVKGSSLIEVNGDALSSTIYDSSYARPTGKLTRLSASLGREKLERMFKFEVPVNINVYNPATKERSNTFVFVRKDPKAPQ